MDDGKEDENDSIIIHDNSTEILNILWLLKDLSLTIELKLVTIIEDMMKDLSQQTQSQSEFDSNSINFSKRCD